MEGGQKQQEARRLLHHSGRRGWGGLCEVGWPGGFEEELDSLCILEMKPKGFNGRRSGTREKKRRQDRS